MLYKFSMAGTKEPKSSIMKNSLINRLLQLSFILIGISINSIVYACEHKFCDEWSIMGLGSVYFTSSRLEITENEITWPGCSSVPYKIISMENDTWILHVPQLSCSGIRKDSGEGYIMTLLSTEEDKELKIKVYDFKGDIKKDQELAWGEFYRIPFDRNRNFFGQIGDYAISMHLEVSKKGLTEGYYYYDKYKQEIRLSGKLDGEDIILNVYDDNNNILETFKGKYLEGKINGVWKRQNKSLKLYLAREPLEDHYISCEEMKKYPKKVFLDQRDLDLGSGYGSPTGVDYNCEGGLATLKFIKNLYDLTEVIRSEGPQHICTGSSVHAYWRYYNFNLLKAGLAPEIHTLHSEQWEREEYKDYRMYQNQLNYFKLWSHQSLYNFELYNTFWNEYNLVKPMLVSHYKKTFNVSTKKAAYYAEHALRSFAIRAAGSFFYDLQGGKPDILLIEKTLSNTGATINDLKGILSDPLPQDELNQALKVALLYQKPQNILEILLEKGAKLNSGYESTLFFALRNHSHVRLLLNRDADVNYTNGFGKTALFYAIGFNDHALVQLLIDHKAEVNHSYKSKEALDGSELPFYQSYCLLRHTKRTPLMHAAQHSDVAMIKLLLRHGAKLDAVDEQGFNVADYALMEKRLDNMDYLKSLGLQGNKLK